tara:strand:- start:8748 stop:8915 length:168 start_codon:yes stop_codon:yes gene_type:complete
MKPLLKEVSDVLIINTSALAISFTTVEMGLKLLLLLLSIIYTIIKITNTKTNGKI